MCPAGHSLFRGENIFILKKIQEIRNVNALPDNSELSFAHKWLTVIYGENGTGKSGQYTVISLTQIQVVQPKQHLNYVLM